jgi:NADH-quinone oxidoreductase subunit E
VSDFAKHPVSPLPDQDPERHFSDDDLVWTGEEENLIERYREQYPTNESAVMHVLWLAQEKFGWLAPEVIQFVADTLDIPYAHTYGVATFYTQYYKEKQGQFVLDVCTCFSCQACGGYDILHYLEDKLDIEEGETTDDEMFTVRSVECLGACGSAPMMQVANGRYVHNLTEEKVDTLIEALREGEDLTFESVTLPQDEDEMDGNRRSDVDRTETYRTPPVAESVE